MHELSITRALLGLVLEKSGSRKTVEVNLVLGELSGMAEECLALYFRLLSEGTPAEGARLNIRWESPHCLCLDCRHRWPSVRVPILCPCCESREVQIRGGTELKIESIEVEDEDTDSGEYSQSQRPSGREQSKLI